MTADAPPLAAALDVHSPAARAARLKGAVLLSLVTAVWGSTFVVTRSLVSGDAAALSPAQLVLSRFVIAAVLFAPFFRRDPRLWAAGVELGVLLWAGFATQTIGLRYTSASRSAFITSLNCVCVPVLAAVAGRRVAAVVWVAMAVAVAGTALLCYDGSPPNAGDAWTFATGVTYGVYIYRLEAHAHRFPAKPLAASQLGVVALLCAVWAVAEGAPVAPPTGPRPRTSSTSAWPPPP